MNFLLSMPNDGQSNNYIINALQTMGHSVVYLDHRSNYDYCSTIIPNILSSRKIDIFLVLYLEENKTYSKEYIRKLKKDYPNTTYCSWIFDATLGNKLCDENDYLLDLAREYDCFFTVCRGQVENLRHKGVDAYHVPEGACPFTFDFSKQVVKSIDVSFIGQMGHKTIHKERFPLMQSIIKEFPNTIIAGYLHDFSCKDINKCHIGRPTYNDIDHSKLIAHTRVNIGHSGWPFIEGYFSARNYRIMASGGFLLANNSNGIESYFDIGKEIDVYNNEKECLEKIKYYLENTEEREAIAKRGKDKVLNDYTFIDSMQKIVDIVKKTK